MVVFLIFLYTEVGTLRWELNVQYVYAHATMGQNTLDFDVTNLSLASFEERVNICLTLFMGSQALFF